MMNRFNFIHRPVFRNPLVILLLAYFLIAYILPLGARDLLVPDETRYAEIPREMIDGGDWVSPRLNGVRYFEKPVLGYWVHAGSLLLFGQNNFAVRLPSALAVGLTAMLVFYLVRRQNSSENHFTAVAAVLIFLSCFEVFGVGNTAILDSLFSFFLTATLVAFYAASEAPARSSEESCLLALAGLGCGLAFLTKGFLAIALPALVLVPYLVWQGRMRELFRMSLIPMTTAALTVMPWGIWIHFREPDFWHFFFWNEHIRRFMADNAQHRESFWFFFAAAPGLALPWTFLVPAAMPGIRTRLSDREASGRLAKLSVCWLALPFLFFSLSKGKLLTYILPCFPPFAVLMAFGLSALVDNTGKFRRLQAGMMAAVISFAVLLIIFWGIQVFGFGGVHLYSRSWQAVMAANALLFLALFSFWAYRIRSGKGKTLLFGLAPAFLFFISHFIIPDPTLEAKAPGPLLTKHCPAIAANDIVISDDDTVRAVCWSLKRDDVYVLGGAGELDYGLGYREAAGRWLDIPSAVRLIRNNRGKVVLIARAKKYSRWQTLLPAPMAQEMSGPSGYVVCTY